jgi:hypothetical protein
VLLVQEFSTVPVRSKGKNISGYASYNGIQWQRHMFRGGALYASLNSGATAAQIKTALLNSDLLHHFLENATGGRLNVRF